MAGAAMGPRGARRGRGARERILAAAQQLFRAQGINGTTLDGLCAEAQVSKRTAYQHFGSKDELVAAYLQSLDPSTMPEVFEDPLLTPRARLLGVFDRLSMEGGAPLCPFLQAAVEIPDPGHPARVRVAEYKRAVAVRLTEAAQEAGAADPGRLGEQLALLLDGASIRTRALGVDTASTAAAIAVALVEEALPSAAAPR